MKKGKMSLKSTKIGYLSESQPAFGCRPTFRIHKNNFESFFFFAAKRDKKSENGLK